MKEIDYYKNNEILENSYYQIPQELFVNSLYKEKLNSDSKILYAFLLDRLSLSQKNHWFDEYGRVYLIFTREEVQDKLCWQKCSSIFVEFCSDMKLQKYALYCNFI